jgi:hypothetical protein
MSETQYLKAALLVPLVAPAAAWLACLLGFRDQT